MIFGFLRGEDAVKSILYLNYLHIFEEYYKMEFLVNFTDNMELPNFIPRTPILDKIDSITRDQKNVLMCLKSSKVLKLKLDKL